MHVCVYVYDMCVYVSVYFFTWVCVCVGMFVCVSM